jgi:hypothetical protein
MAVCSEGLAIDPCVGEGVYHFFLSTVQHFSYHCCGSDFHENDVVETDTVKGVFKGYHPLDLMRLDHGGQHILHHQRHLTPCHGVSGEVIRHCENSPQIVRGMAPFCSEPGVVEVQPADHSADIKGCLHRVELEPCAWDPCTVGDDGAGNDGAQKLCASGIS